MSGDPNFHQMIGIGKIQEFTDKLEQNRAQAQQSAGPMNDASDFGARVDAALKSREAQLEAVRTAKDAPNFFGYKAPDKGQDPVDAVFGLTKNASVGNLWEIKPAAAHGGTVWGGGGSIWGSGEQSTNNFWGGGSVHGPRHDVTDIHGNVTNDHWCSSGGGVSGWGSASNGSSNNVYGNHSGFWGGGSDDSNGSGW